VNILHWKQLGLILTGVALSSVFLWLALRHVGGEGFRSAFSSIRYGALLGCAAFLAAGVMLRFVRWRTIAWRPWAAQHYFLRTTTLVCFQN
jgi:hypothetical protein